VEGDLAGWLDFDHIMQVGVAGVVVWSLRAFGNRLTKLEEADKEQAGDLTELRVTMAEKFVTREEISGQHRDIRVDMKAHHEVQMQRMAQLLSALENRVERVESDREAR
jgi:uncharacterized coiled-coil protein SlyX